MQADKNRLLKVILAFAAIYIIWGTTYLVIRVAVETIPPFFMAGSRFVVAGVLTFIFLRARGVPSPQRRHWPAAVVIGGLLLAGGSGLVTWSEQTIPSGVAALVIATVPLWTTLFDWLFYRGGTPSKRVIAGILLGFLGIALLIGPGQFSGTAAFSWIALSVLLLSPILWSFGSLYSRQARLPHSSFMATAMEMFAGGILLIIAGLLTGEAGRLDLAAISTTSWLSLLYLIFFGSMIAFTAYIWLLKTVSASKVTTYGYVNPIIAVFLGGLILNEPVTASMIAAMVIIVVAVFLITVRQRQPSTPGQESNEQDRPPMAVVERPPLSSVDPTGTAAPGPG